MIRTIALLLLIVQTATAQTKSSNELPLSARQALTAWNFKFKPFDDAQFTDEVRELFKNSTDEQPMKVEGDFNNDKKTDYILLGSAEKQQIVVALVSDKQNFKPVVLQQWSRNDFTNMRTYLAKVKPGEIPGRKQKYDMVQVEVFQGSTDLYEIKDYKAIKLN